MASEGPGGISILFVTQQSKHGTTIAAPPLFYLFFLPVSVKA